MAIPDFYSTEKENHKVREVTRWIVDIIVALSVAAIAGVFFLGRVTVSGRSMEPILFNGDVVLIDSFSYEWKKPERLDIVYFTKTDENGNNRTSVKRLIGLPGERIQIKENHIFINGRQAYFPQDLSNAILAGTAEEEILLGSDEYFVLGDNRDNSEDSRFTTIGLVTETEIVGKVWFRVQPLDDMGMIRK